MTSLAVFVIAVLSLLIVKVPRKYAPVVMLVCACTMPLGSNVLIGGVNFTSIRVIVFFAFLRIFLRREYRSIKMNKIDTAVLLLFLMLLLTRIISSRRDVSFMGRLGDIYDLLGFYFSFRCWIREKNDILVSVKGLCLLVTAVACEMIYEKIAFHNLFSSLGGVDPEPAVRNGTIRAQGPFAHAILAGTVGATSFALFVALWWQKRRLRKYTILGSVASLVVILTCGSSGPVLSFLAILMGMFSWHQRDKLKMMRWAIPVVLISLEIVMQSHVWYLIGRIDITGSSSSWHRSELINSALIHLDEWWFAGTDYTRHWMPTGVSWSTLHTDITNQFIKVGVLGGLSAVFFFILMMARGFGMVGGVVTRLQDAAFSDRILVWFLGATLFSHLITFFGVNYFDQTELFYYFNLALIACSRTIFTTKRVKTAAAEKICLEEKQESLYVVM